MQARFCFHIYFIFVVSVSGLFSCFCFTAVLLSAWHYMKGYSRTGIIPTGFYRNPAQVEQNSGNVCLSNARWVESHDSRPIRGNQLEKKLLRIKRRPLHHFRESRYPHQGKKGPGHGTKNVTKCWGRSLVRESTTQVTKLTKLWSHFHLWAVRKIRFLFAFCVRKHSFSATTQCTKYF